MTFYGQSNPPEDKIAAALFGDYVGTFCEVGAFNGRDLSNTMYFYERGWAGINFEPHPDNYAALCINQPEAINLCCAVGATVGYANIKTAPDKPIVTAFNPPDWYVKDEVKGGWAGLVEFMTPVLTLSMALEIHGVAELDYLSVDTDGTELEVLRGIDLDRWKPRLIVLEYNHDRQRIDRYLALNGGYERAYDNGLNAFYTRTADDARTIQRAANDR